MLCRWVWQVAPFAFVVFYAGLQTLNMDSVESAIIDGATRWQRPRYIVIPHLMPRWTGIGPSAFEFATIGMACCLAWRIVKRLVPVGSAALAPKSGRINGWIIAVLAYSAMLMITAVPALPAIIGLVDPLLDLLGTPIIGLTAEHYISVWNAGEFYRNFIDSMIVTSGVAAVSLSVGMLAGFGLAHSRM